MLRVQKILPNSPKITEASANFDQVVLDFEDRHRRRIALTSRGGVQFLLDLPEARLLQDGEGLLLENGAVIKIVAAPEDLLEIHAHDQASLVRIAWHLGNRHLVVQLIGDVIRIRADHVIADMVRGLGGHVHEIQAAFTPESGAYHDSGHAHVHGHGHGHHHHHHHHEHHHDH